MKKEEFLAFSLPYGLKCKLNNIGIFNLDEEYPEPHNEICEITNVLKSNEGFEYEISDGNISYGFIESEEFDIILHPMSDLTKRIEHNGEKFVPIIELAKIGFDVYDNLKIKVKSEDKISGCIFLDEDNDIIVFVYHYETQSFCAHYHVTMQFISVHYQLKMFQKLIEWHFDIAGLIDKGEAIDVNTLEINPYK